MYQHKEDVSHILDIMEVLEELDKLNNLENHQEDGHKNLSMLYQVYFKILKQMLMQKIQRIQQQIMFKLIELLKVEEELIEHMAELDHIYQVKHILNYGQMKNHKTLKNKEKENKQQKEKSQLDKNDAICLFKLKIQLQIHVQNLKIKQNLNISLSFCYNSSLFISNIFLKYSLCRINQLNFLVFINIEQLKMQMLQDQQMDNEIQYYKLSTIIQPISKNFFIQIIKHNFFLRIFLLGHQSPVETLQCVYLIQVFYYRFIKYFIVKLYLSIIVYFLSILVSFSRFNLLQILISNSGYFFSLQMLYMLCLFYFCHIHCIQFHQNQLTCFPQMNYLWYLAQSDWKRNNIKSLSAQFFFLLSNYVSFQDKDKIFEEKKGFVLQQNFQLFISSIFFVFFYVLFMDFQLP